MHDSPYLENENSTRYIGKLNRKLGCHLEVPPNMTRMHITLLTSEGTFFTICSIDLEKVEKNIFTEKPFWSPECLFRIDFTGPKASDED